MPPTSGGAVSVVTGLAGSSAFVRGVELVVFCSGSPLTSRTPGLPVVVDCPVVIRVVVLSGILTTTSPEASAWEESATGNPGLPGMAQQYRRQSHDENQRQQRARRNLFVFQELFDFGHKNTTAFLILKDIGCCHL